MAEQIEQTWSAADPATITSLLEFLQRARDAGYPDYTKVEVLVNFSRGIKSARVRKA